MVVYVGPSGVFIHMHMCAHTHTDSHLLVYAFVALAQADALA